MSDTIDYGGLMHRAMRGLIQNVLLDVDQNGLPGAHHFFITFDTRHEDAKLADWLRERYPDDMTVVIQHWYDDLEITDQGFGITLNFGDAPENMYIPYDAIRTFVDPSVEFGLRFETQEDVDGEAAEPNIAPDIAPAAEMANDSAPSEADNAPTSDAEVVSLDSFRKP